MARRHDYFSLEEANAVIPTLEYYFRHLVVIQHDLSGLQRTLQASGATLGKDGVELPADVDPEVHQLRDRYQQQCQDYDHVVEEILSLGVEIVDPEAGIVNFYTWCDGEELLLNWQYGEPSIGYWLDPGEPFHDRRPLRQLFAHAEGLAPLRH